MEQKDVGDLLKNFSTFSTKRDAFDCKTLFLPERMLRITEIKFKIAIKLTSIWVLVNLRHIWDKLLTKSRYSQEKGHPTFLPWVGGNGTHSGSYASQCCQIFE